jgi:hypothetical protein
MQSMFDMLSVSIVGVEQSGMSETSDSVRWIQPVVVK